MIFQFRIRTQVSFAFASQVDRKLRAKLVPTARTSICFQGGRRESRASHRDEEEVVQAEDEEENDKV